MELTAALGIPFGAAGWLALLLHTFAIECYVSYHYIPAGQPTENLHTDGSGITAETDTQRIRPLTSSKPRPPTRTRYVPAWIRRLNSRAIRRCRALQTFPNPLSQSHHRDTTRVRGRKTRARVKNSKTRARITNHLYKHISTIQINKDHELPSRRICRGLASGVKGVKEIG